MSQVSEVNNSNFQNEVLDSKVPVLVDFWAPWCMPCKMMAPILDQLAVDMNDKIKIAKVNTEEPGNDQLAIKYQIQSIPNMKLFNGGQVVAEFIGLRAKDALRADIEAFLNK